VTNNNQRVNFFADTLSSKYSTSSSHNKKENPAGLHRRGVPSSSRLTNAHGDENAQTQIRIALPVRAHTPPAADNKPALAHNTPEPERNTLAQARNKPEPAAHTPLAAPHKPPEPDT
jgi:hypothetical protein